MPGQLHTVSFTQGKVPADTAHSMAILSSLGNEHVRSREYDGIANMCRGSGAKALTIVEAISTQHIESLVR